MGLMIMMINNNPTHNTTNKNNTNINNSEINQHWIVEAGK